MGEPWAIGRGAVEANESDLKKAAAINQLLVRPIPVLPVRLGDPIKPFSIGLWTDIRALLKSDVTVSSLRRTTSAYTHSKRYVLATAQLDSRRHDVDGNAISEVSDENRLAAQQYFTALTKVRKEKKAREVSEPVETTQPQPQSAADRIRAGLLSRNRSSISPGE